MHVSRARARVGAVASLGADALKMPTDTIRGRLVGYLICQNIHTSHIRFGDVAVLTTTFIGRRGHATYDHPGATRGSRSRVTVHTSRGEELLRGVTRTSSFHPRSSRPIRFLRISYHTRHPSRATERCARGRHLIPSSRAKARSASDTGKRGRALTSSAQRARKIRKTACPRPTGKTT